MMFLFSEFRTLLVELFKLLKARKLPREELEFLILEARMGKFDEQMRAQAEARNRRKGK